ATVIHGRVDGPVPEKKLLEFERTAGAAQKASEGTGSASAAVASEGSGQKPVKAKPKAAEKTAPVAATALKRPSVAAASAAAAAIRGQLEDDIAPAAAPAAKRPSTSAATKPQRSEFQGPNLSLCMARTWGDGYGSQCLKPPLKVGGLCPSHQKYAEIHDGLPSHGRIDGPIPAKKLLEFQKFAEAHPSSVFAAKTAAVPAS
ncbi:unnamed protein product, partial [Polarella glacialis]